MIRSMLAVVTAGVVAIAISVTGCTTTAGGDPAPIWDSTAQRFITEAVLINRLAQANLVLLGEVHDNAEHHAAQKRVLDALYARGRRPTLVMEQFDTEHAGALADAWTTAPATISADELAARGRFDRRGWEWRFYEPLISAALAGGARVVAANLSRDAARQVMREGFAALGADRAEALGLPPRLAADQVASMTGSIVDGHCGMLKPEEAAPMVRAQQARDAVMAAVLARHGASGAVLIAGAGHVRRDLGVPFYLREYHALAAVAVGMVEVAVTDAGGAEKTPVRNPPPTLVAQFDYVWMTAPITRPDPCVAFRGTR